MTTVYEMTRMALAEFAASRVLAAYDCIPPSRVGHPTIGCLGFMSPGDRLDLCRAADLAHRAHGTEGWGSATPEERALYIARDGLWRHRDNVRRRAVKNAIWAYAQVMLEDSEEGTIDPWLRNFYEIIEGKDPDA